MSKLAVLKVGRGNFDRGFPVTLQIGAEAVRPSVEVTGELPPAPHIPEVYRRWQAIYRHLDFTGRPVGLPKAGQPSATIWDCELAARELRDRLNDWLDAKAFRPIREKWLEQLSPTEIIRAVIQTDDPQLRRLPWHLWELTERYPQAEIALSPLEFGSRLKQMSAPTPKVRILAILGTSQGIDVQKDRAVLAELQDAQVTFLVEPDRQDLNDQLWEQSWEILFFAGHSVSKDADETGFIHLNASETLSISQLKHGLEKAVDRGLKLAIFNSCDGLGLARELAYLQIPQLIVMREPVPDLVAQEFLKYFLATYATGESLYTAVKDARVRLQGLEHRFPCATWLPVICQHPAEVPPTWNELRSQTPEPQPVVSQANVSQAKITWGRSSFKAAVAMSMAISGILIGVRLAGVLQSAELRAFDHLMQLRPKEPQDSRLLIIEVTEKDIQDQNQQDPQRPQDRSLSNRALEQLLDRLEPLQPRLIGLDIYRDYPAGQEYPRLATALKTSDRLIAVCKRGDPNSSDFGIHSPPEVLPEQALSRLGFSNVVSDQDTVIRRHLLTITPTTVCPADYALSVQLALQYLATEKIFLEFTPQGNWKLRNTIISPIRFPTGGYFNIDGRGHQILLNYRSPDNASSFHTPEEIAPRISLGNALAGGLTSDLVKDKIVLIGTTARNSQFQDYFPTPYRDETGKLHEIPGVMLHAQMTSQMMSAVLDGRPLLWALPLWGEAIWVLAWSLMGAGLALYLQRFILLSGASAVAIATLYSMCLVLLIQFGCWLPLVPAALACFGSMGFVVLSRLRFA